MMLLSGLCQGSPVSELMLPGHLSLATCIDISFLAAITAAVIPSEWYLFWHCCKQSSLVAKFKWGIFYTHLPPNYVKLHYQTGKQVRHILSVFGSALFWHIYSVHFISPTSLIICHSFPGDINQEIIRMMLLLIFNLHCYVLALGWILSFAWTLFGDWVSWCFSDF